MATRRTTSDKRQRERDKQQKAAAKRARRQGQTGFDGPEPAVEVADDESSTEQLIARMEALHADYDAGKVSFDDFEKQKSALLDRIAIRLAQ
jgi:hypothetical protein